MAPARFAKLELDGAKGVVRIVNFSRARGIAASQEKASIGQHGSGVAAASSTHVVSGADRASSWIEDFNRRERHGARVNASYDENAIGVVGQLDQGGGVGRAGLGEFGGPVRIAGGRKCFVGAVVDFDGVGDRDKRLA